MKEQTLYICEICGTQYKNKKSALDCEKNHHVPIQVRQSYCHFGKCLQDGYPDRIEIVFDDGEILTYKR